MERTTWIQPENRLWYSHGPSSPCPYHKMDQQLFSLLDPSSAPASLQPQRALYSPGRGSAKGEGNISNMACSRNLRAPISKINLESLTKGTVQPDLSQQISLTGSPQPPNLRLQGLSRFWGGGQNQGSRNLSFAPSESTFPWTEVI